MKKITLIVLLSLFVVSCDKSNKTKEVTEEIELDTMVNEPNLKSAIKVGQVLIAKNTIEDPIFAKTVILITKIKDEKIYGVILNKETNEKISDYIENVNQNDFPIGFGGPMQKDVLLFIQTFDNESENSTEILDGLYFLGDINILKEKVQNNSISKDKVRFFKGVVVWNFNQLDKEVNEWKDWKMINLNIIEIMNSNTHDLWRKYNN